MLFQYGGCCISAIILCQKGWSQHIILNSSRKLIHLLCTINLKRVFIILKFLTVLSLRVKPHLEKTASRVHLLKVFHCKLHCSLHAQVFLANYFPLLLYHFILIYDFLSWITPEFDARTRIVSYVLIIWSMSGKNERFTLDGVKGN